jgi:ubiquinone/menaquinone biosynthesis C-methylase UbiE
MAGNMTDSTQRFSDRVEAYVKFRPGYPSELVQTLLQKTMLDAGAAVADIGSGTGIFTRLLLDQQLKVFAIEPNANMRHAAEALFTGYPAFTSVDAPAEDTGLAEHSVDLITAAQAFHWFNNAATKAEFRRILKADGKLALIWNKRKISQPFQQAYDVILKTYAPEYGVVNHMNLSEADIAEFFDDGQMEVLRFDNCQQLTFPGLLGRLKSSSYCPAENSPQYPSLVAELAGLFEQFAVNQLIDFQYDTLLYLGPIAA